MGHSAIPDYVTDIFEQIQRPVLREKPVNPRYSASLFGFCDRKLYYKRGGVPGIERLSFQAEARMEIGNAVHGVLQRRFQKMRGGECLIEPQLSPLVIAPGIELSMRPDLVVFFTDPDMDFVCDIKVPRKHTSTGLHKYLAQLACYNRRLGIARGYFAEFDRTGLQLVLASGDVEAGWNTVLRTVEYIEDCLAKRLPPGVPTDKSKMLCYFDLCCEYAHLCYGGD